jgi:glycosyltransferase involved in cell wall biosynthesis
VTLRGSPIALIDATPVTSSNTGVARYTSELIRALPEAGAVVRPYAVGRGTHPAPPGTVRFRLPERLIERWWRSTGVPRIEHLIKGADLVHATGLEPPPTRLPLVMTIHDVLAVTRPDLHTEAAVARQRRHLAALGRATVVLSVSQTTADDLVRLGLSADRIEVTRMACAPLPSPAPVPGVGPGFVLAVGELHPRKGLDVLIRSLVRATEVTIVIAGPDAGAGPALARLASELDVDRRVRFVGRVSDAQLAWLYHEAMLLAFASRGEGFGLPLLEALGAGLPVIASDLPVFREVAGEAAMFFPVGDPAALGSAMAHLARDGAARRDLARAGLDRARGFTWEATAEATVACYRRVVK